MVPDWPAKKDVVTLPSRSNRNSKCFSTNSLGLFIAQNKDTGTAYRQ